MENQNDLKIKILDSIRWVRENLNYTLVSEDWGNKEKQCACAMGCVLIQDDPEDLLQLKVGSKAHQAAKIIGVEEKWIDSFTEGFDDTGRAFESKVPEAWEIGMSIAQETKPIRYSDFANEVIKEKPSKKKLKS